MITVLFLRVRVRWRKCARFWKLFKHLLRHIPPASVQSAAPLRALPLGQSVACCSQPVLCVWSRVIACSRRSGHPEDRSGGFVIACVCAQRLDRAGCWCNRYEQPQTQPLHSSSGRTPRDPSVWLSPSDVVPSSHTATALLAVRCRPWVSDTARQLQSGYWPCRLRRKSSVCRPTT